jgi:16S rRNA G966 N2-methylase RsmD
LASDGSAEERQVAPRKAGRRVSHRVPYNDLDLRRWREYEDIETDSLWLIPSRDRGDGHQLDYHGNFIPQIARQAYLRYTREGDLVLDMFLGSGTSAIEARRLGRRCVGVELKPELVEQVRGKFANLDELERPRLIQGDSSDYSVVAAVRAALADFGSDAADLLLLHPPYDDIIRFSDRPEDLSNSSSTEEFLERFGRVAAHGFELLAPGRFAVLVIGDKYARGELVPLGFQCMARMTEAGFRTKALVVKNIEGNELGKGPKSNLWRYRALAGGFYVFKHEYVMIFQKPVGKRPRRAIEQAAGGDAERREK